MDYIFIIGPSAVGKTTLAKALFEHYKGAYVEQNMAPEFCIPDEVEDVGVFEEEVCWESMLAQIRHFHGRGIHNIVALDFDDVRARELPEKFKGSDFVILRLISSDAEQIKKQMEHRKNNEGGLYAPDYVERSNSVIAARKLLPNEVEIDVAGKNREQIFAEAVDIIDGFAPEKDYIYTLDDEHNYLSWVKSRALY